MKILLAFGTRPEAIKMCPLIKLLKRQENIECVVCLTGQHKEMLDQIMTAFNIVPDYNLAVMKEKQTLSSITSSVITGIDIVLEKEKPDIVLVHGDTTTTMAAALSAFYQHIPIGHVEAGLRTYNMHSPFPEEFNRQAVDLFADLLFAPTENAKLQLIKEGKDSSKIFVTGNTVIDALKTTIKSDYYNEHLKWAEGSKLILLTSHRRENIGKPMESIFHAVRKIVDDNTEVKVIYPIHKNPVIREIAAKYLEKHERIRIIEPLDVLDFHNFMNKSYLILTDSGGIQEEAPSLGKPVLVMRDTTERPEGIDSGTLKLVGTNEDKIYNETAKILKDNETYKKMSNAVNPYGDGHASERIIEAIKSYFKER